MTKDQAIALAREFCGVALVHNLYTFNEAELLAFANRVREEGRADGIREAAFEVMRIKARYPGDHGGRYLYPNCETAQLGILSLLTKDPTP